MAIIVTGAGGFIGRRFMEYNKSRYHLVPVSLRTAKVNEIDMTGIQVIVHLAVVAHDFSKVNNDVQYEVNYHLTKELAEHAKKCGVTQFIFLSTAKVYGEGSSEVLDENSQCSPVDAYGKSKRQAEEYLLSQNSERFKVAIIRTPIVYGPEVKGNMFRLLKLSNKNIPLPFGHSDNLRSMVYIDNLIELINSIMELKASGIFIAGDTQPISTGELIAMIRKSLNKRENLIVIPAFAKKVLKKIKPSLFNRLFGSFVLDTTKTNLALNFKPPYATSYGIDQMVKWFVELQKPNRTKEQALQ